MIWVLRAADSAEEGEGFKVELDDEDEEEDEDEEANGLGREGKDILFAQIRCCALCYGAAEVLDGGGLESYCWTLCDGGSGL